MLAVARQPAYTSLPSFQDAEGPSELDDGLLDFAMPPPSTIPMRRTFAFDHNSKLATDHTNSKLDDDLQAPSTVFMRRSLQKIRSRQSSTTSAPLKRTLSQKRKRQQVCFAPNDQLAEIRTFEAVPEDCKGIVWYSGKDLSQQTYDELYRNWELHLERGCKHPLEEYCPDLTWRGLEDHIPSASGDEDGVAKRMEKIRQYVLIMVAIARTVDDDAEVAERSGRLSKSDRDEAIEKAQKDAYEAMREHGAEFGRPPVPYDCYRASDNRRGSGSVIHALVTWFCATDV